ncbi:TolC family protein, partial [Myxococcota bacterium]|nr:TolC family protein [Myxococcota bacterium]
ALAEAEAAEALSAARLAGLEAYWALWYTQRAAALSQAHDEAAIATLREAQARAELGALADVDLIPLRLAHVEATSAVLEATADLQGARLMLAARLGLPATAAPGLRAAVAPTPITILSEAEILAALQDAYAARAPRLARQAAEDAAQITARAAQPQLDAEVGISAYGLSGAGIDDALNGLGAVEGQGAWAGLRLVLPLGDELRAAEAASARLNLEAAKAALLARRQALAAEALATRAALVAAQGRVALMETAAQLAVLAESGQRARFEAGDETATALTMASAARQAAQLRHAQAQVEVIRLDLRLRHALALPLRAWTP